jgi:hypothetical protein
MGSGWDGGEGDEDGDEADGEGDGDADSAEGSIEVDGEPKLEGKVESPPGSWDRFLGWARLLFFLGFRGAGGLAGLLSPA